jgi:hypothetical protein
VVLPQQNRASVRLRVCVQAARAARLTGFVTGGIETTVGQTDTTRTGGNQPSREGKRETCANPTCRTYNPIRALTCKNGQEMTDRHKRPPKAVRMPGGLLAWYKAEAERRGQTVNALIVAALEEFRQEAESGATARAGAPEPGATTERARKPAAKEPAQPKCAHRFVVKGWCKECREYVGQKK